MKIYGEDGLLVLDVEVDDTSYAQRRLLGEDVLELHYSLTEYVELPVGSWCEFQGRHYTLGSPQNFTVESRREYRYKVFMEGTTAHLRKYVLRDTTLQGRLKFSLTARPEQFLSMIVGNMNLRESGWTSGGCIEGTERTVTFNHSDCLEALQSVADAFSTEWEVEGKTIHLRKVEYNKESPVALRYGRGGGFLPGVGRENYAEGRQVEVLFVQGGSRNIDALRYGSTELLLPCGQRLKYDGAHFEGEPGYDAGRSREYVSDAEGLSVRRWDKPLTHATEGSVDLTDIYPSRKGRVTSVETVAGRDSEGNPVTLYDIVDTSIPPSLDYGGCLMSGETLSVVFQTGRLAGREFDVRYDHAQRRFEIVPATMDGVEMPGGMFVPSAGDEYAVFGCMLPDAYIRDDATQSGASWDMYREAVRRLCACEDPQYSFTGELDGIYASAHWLEIGGKLEVGGYVAFTSDTFVEGGSALIRIVGVKTYVNRPKKPVLELSDRALGGVSLSAALGRLEAQEELIESVRKESIHYTKRRWRDVQAVKEELKADFADGFGESINPVTVETMQLIVGSEKLQFVFVDRKTDPQKVVSVVPQHDADTDTLGVPAAILKHMTLGVTAVSSKRDPSQYRYWDVAAYTSPALEADKLYRLYVKCSKSDDTAVYVLSEDNIGMEEVSGHYHFLMGYLGKLADGSRSFGRVHGFTEVLPGQITTDVIQDPEANLVIDLVRGTVTGKVTITNGSSGLENFTEWSSQKTEIKSYTDAVAAGLQAQIDGQIESWFYQYDPTSANHPASGWTTAADKEAHLNDTFTNLNTGASWRWSRNGNTYSWVAISDTATQKALLAAGQAQDTADGKRRVFTATPYPPYDVGDLWVQGATGDILKCKAAKTAVQSYSASDWDKASKYTDDSSLTAFIGGTYASDKAALQANIDGKIESYYQSGDPSSAWTTAALKSVHTGDIWYNSGTKVTYRWTGASWSKLEDSDAAAAKDIAAGKNSIFLTQPSNYKAGDLWILASAATVNGTAYKAGEVLTAAQAGTTYVASHWSKKVYYDNTQTTIDGGIVTSGTVQLAGSSGSILAGITGNGTAATSVRIWAGSTFANRASAPFRVLQDGTMYATKAVIKGTVESTDATISGTIKAVGDGGTYGNGSYIGGFAFGSSMMYPNDATMRGTVYGNPRGASVWAQGAFRSISQDDKRLANLKTMHEEADEPLLQLTRTDNSVKDGSGKLTNRMVQFQTSSGGSLRQFIVEMRNVGDADWFRRVCIRTTVLPYRTQVANIPAMQNANSSTEKLYYVLWDSRSGCFCISDNYNW